MSRIASIIVCLALPAAAQSTLSTTDRFGYGANTGWIDFRPSQADGTRVTETFLSGKAYAANFGWIDLGNGTPANGHTYSNASAADFGVNLSPSGLLTGQAYAANIGWLTFEQTHGQPKLNLLTGKFTGHAWSANAGWISLDTPDSDLLTTTIASPDTDGDGIADAWEMLHFGDLATADEDSNADGDPASDLAEYEADTDPESSSAWLRVMSQNFNAPVTEITIQLTSGSGRLYRIEQDEDLIAPWTDSGLGTFSPDAGATTTKTFTFPAGTRRFFRAVAIRPLQP